MKNMEAIYTRKYRERLLGDAYRPAYHFAVPDDLGIPGDPNGAFFANGVYHLMYLYKSSSTEGFHWGHVSSIDLLHWRHHPDALTCFEGDKGCFSGGGFVDDDGTAYLSFWKFPSPERDRGGIAIAYSKPPYDVWERMENVAIETSELWGTKDLETDAGTVYAGCADPSNIWKQNGKYYIQTGNKKVLDRFGRGENADPYFMGDWTDLFCSEDLKKWEYAGRFYRNRQMGVDGWPDASEDDMCPSFLPLYDAEENGRPTGKYLQLFISHNKGCQYYIGRLEGDEFIPEQHGRMTWVDNSYFAPEALIDGKNRHIMWAWLMDSLPDDFDRFGWSGVLGIPRNLWYEDGELKMSPVSELDALEYGHIGYTETDGDSIRVGDGELCRIKAVWSGNEKAGVAVKVSDDGREYTEIYYSPREKKLVMDTTHSGSEGRLVREEAPFALREGEELVLDILIDRAVVEVYANKRQAICRRVYPTDPKNSKGIRLIGDTPKRLDTYKMFPTNPY